MKPQGKPTNEMLPANPSQNAQERADELREEGQHVLVVGDTQVLYCAPEVFEKYKDSYRCFNRSRK